MNDEQKEDLSVQCWSLLANLNQSIAYMDHLAAKQGCPPQKLKHMDGTSAYDRLLVAKAQTISTLVSLEMTE